ncbi:Hypothetical protein AJAP_27960 [Amycolatopsis japonica]|uniref:Uncharacterized protein n=1 Tax=Amycolatopsis japonica TaxID=208439 RepID=A0A075UW86_9PSEU|nr:hypothetical protein [Amycolatopsis japonica]AIG78432.1 Hypothetical protein AJAP_27960 [Amycolatopsis japonica]
MSESAASQIFENLRRKREGLEPLPYTATNYFVQEANGPTEAELATAAACASTRPKPMTEEQRELYRKTKTITWGYLMGQASSSTGRFAVRQSDPQKLREALRRLEETPSEGDVVVGKGPMTGRWFVGRYVRPHPAWRNESIVDGYGRLLNLLTTTLMVVERAK